MEALTADAVKVSLTAKDLTQHHLDRLLTPQPPLLTIEELSGALTEHQSRAMTDDLANRQELVTDEMLLPSMNH